MKQIKDIFRELRENDKYQRIDIGNPVAWYAGLDSNSRYSLFAITKTQPKYMSSTKVMDVFVGSRKDGNYGITFSLLEKKNLDLFAHFCEDIVTYTQNLKDENKDADYVLSRYLLWQKAFIKTAGKILSYEEIKGLIGELYFLKMRMMIQYGTDKALESWTGIEATDQDFLCDDTWYEVKSTVSGSSTVKISSVEQLDVSTEGHLVVVTLDKTSEADSSRITLNNIVELVVESIPEKVLQDRLMSRLLEYGYFYDKAYDGIGFKYNGMDQYVVNDKFPCLRKTQIPVSVQNAKYELSLPAIALFKED